MTKENKTDIKKLIASYYIIKDIKNYVIFVSLVNTINK